MRRLALFSFISSLSIFPCYGVYLEYEDDKDSQARHITIHFADTDNNNENVRRIGRVLSKTGLSLTETERIPGTYRRRNQCIFTSQSAATFIEWIQTSIELKSLKFFGINEPEDVVSVRNALNLIAQNHQTSALADEFVLIEEKPTTTVKKAGFEMQPIGPTPARVSDDIWQKFNRLEITCSGTKAVEARQVARSLIAEHYIGIEDRIVVIEPKKIGG